MPFNLFAQEVLPGESPRAGFSCGDASVSIGNSPCCVLGEITCIPNVDNPSGTWRFGDGTTITSSEPVEHCYCEPGTYTVSLTSHGYTFSSPVQISGPCLTPSSSSEIISFSGCSDPGICSEVCSNVQVRMTDTTDPFFDETITGVQWEAQVFNAGDLDYTLYRQGSIAIFTFPEWHAGIRIVIVQTVSTCLGSNNSSRTIKIDCLSGGSNTALVQAGSKNEAASTFVEKQTVYASDISTFGNNSWDRKVINIVQSPESIWLSVPLDAGSFPYHYTLYTASGQRVGKGAIKSGDQTISIGSLTRGFYLLQILDTSGRILKTAKVVKP